MKKIFVFFLCLCLPLATHAEDKILNLYAWTGEISDSVIRRFEKETGIKVNFSVFENNEVMYAKIRASENAGYDLVTPSSYFVERMARQQLIEKLDKSKLPNLVNITKDFANPSFDPQLQHCVPYVWGVTGIFYNDQYYHSADLQKWTDLWNKQFNNKLLLLDDMREVFSMTLLSLGYSANDQNPQHIQAAFLQLKKLMKNIKMFSTETVISIMIDEDATVGMSWNGDAFKAHAENPHMQFVYPKDGFVVWVDNLAIPRNARHREAAYQFINFILRPEIAKEMALANNFATANAAGMKLLPPAIRNNTIIYPSADVMKRAHFQADIKDETLALYAKYWEELKISG